MNELIVRRNELFGEVRFLEVEGKPYAVAKDVAKALGYKKPNDAVNTHCKYTVKRSIPHPQNNAKELEVNFIPEGDIYRLIIRSKLPQAEKFESWVFDEVLPQIRKTGGYIPVKEEDDELTIMSKALLIAQKTLEQKDCLLEQKDCLIEEQKKTIKTKAIKSPYTIEKVRGVLNCSRHVLENHLYTLGWIKWKEDKNIEITNQGRKYLVFINSRVGRPHIEFTEEGLEEITKGRIMK